MKSSSSYCLLIILATVGLNEASLPSFMKVCKRSDADLNGCIKRSIEHLRPTLTNGLPALDIVSLEPLDVGELRVTRNINLNISNFKIHGCSRYHIEHIQANVNKYQFAFVIKFDNLSLIGDYEIDMKLLSIPLKGRGPFLGTIGDVSLPGKIKGHIIKGPSRTFLQLDLFQIQIVHEGFSTLKLGNLFPTNPTLEKIGGKVIDENAGVFFAEIFPVLEVKLSQLLKNIANNIIGHFEADDLFPR